MAGGRPNNTRYTSKIGGMKFSHTVIGRLTGNSRVAPSNFPVAANTFQLIFYDRQGNRVGEISSESYNNLLQSLDFQLLDTGCGEISFRLAAPYPKLFIDYLQRVDVHLYHNERPVYSGFILQRPEPGGSDVELEYSGHGFFQQLEQVLITKRYQNTELTVIVNDILANFVQGSTDITYNAFRVVPISPSYIVKDIEFDRTTATKALESLADIAQNYVFGVDSKRTFFFEPINTGETNRATFMVGSKTEAVRLDQDIEAIENFLSVKAGTTINTVDGNYIGTIGDPASQSLYGIRHATVTVPEVISQTFGTSSNPGDAYRWAESQLNDTKDPEFVMEVSGVDLGTDLFTITGNLRIIGRPVTWEEEVV